MRLEYRIGYTFEDRFTPKYKAFQNAFQKGLQDIEKGFRGIDKELENTFQKLETKARGFSPKVTIKPKVESFGLEDYRTQLQVSPVIDRSALEGFQVGEYETALRVKPLISDDITKEVAGITQKLEAGVEGIGSKLQVKPEVESGISLPPTTLNISGFTLQNIPVIETDLSLKASQAMKDVASFSSQAQKRIYLTSSQAFQEAVSDWREDYKDFTRDLQRKPLEVPTKLDIDDREIKQIQDRSFNLTVFPVISTAKDVAREEAVTLTDALYEGVRYGLRKADLAKAFAEELKKAGGYIGTEELAQGFVQLTEMGVRGTAKEMAEFASMVTRVSRATKLSSEGVAKLTYEMQGLGLSVKDMERVFAYAGGAMEKYNLTQDTVIESLQAFKETGGAVFASLSEDAKEKLLKGMIDLSGKLESLYLDSATFTRQIGALMSGRFEEARGLMTLLGSQAQEFRKALESGDVQKAQQMLMGRLLELRERLATIPPQLRGYYIQQYSELYQIPVDTLTQLVNKSSEEIRQVFSESISPVDIDERMKETTNVITKWTNVIKNKIVGTFGAEFADVIGEGIDTVTQVGGMVAPFLLFKALPYIGGKIGSKALGAIGGIARGFSLPKLSLPKLGAPKLAPVTSIGKGAVAEAAEVASKGGGLLSKVGKLVKFGRVGGALALLGAGIEFATAKTAKEKAEAVGGGAGGLTGALAGAALGSAILPGIGTVIGGVLGGLGGDFIGRKVVGVVSSLFGGEEEKVKRIEQVSKEREVQREKETIKEGRPQDEIAILMAIATKLDVLSEVRDLLSTYLTQQKLKPSPKPVYTGMEDWIDKGFKR